MDRRAWQATVHRVTRVGHDWMTKQNTAQDVCIWASGDPHIFKDLLQIPIKLTSGFTVIMSGCVPCLKCEDTGFNILLYTSKSRAANYNTLLFSSVAQSCGTLCHTMDYSTPGLHVHHQLPELAQIHVHGVGDAIQPSHPLLSPSPPTFNCSQHQGLFQSVSSSHQVAKALEFQLQHQSFQWLFRTDFLYDWLVWCPCSPRDSQGSSPTPQFKSINSSVLSFLYSLTLTSIHDHWKNHSFD